MKLSHYLSTIALAAIFSSCGSQGATGPAGPTGATGATGANGTANIFTTLYTVNSSNWTDPSSDVTWISTWTESDITDNNNDAVVAYWSTASSGWLALPVSSLIASGDEMSFGYNDNSVTFSYYTGGASFTQPPSSYAGFAVIYFKVTVIPPAIQHKYPGTNWQNASEVQKIPEVQAALNNADNR